MIIRKKDLEAKWYTFNKDVKLLIRPFKFSKFKLEDIENSLLEEFDYCVVDWKGIFEDDGKTPYKCNKEHKLELFDYYNPLRIFVALENRKARDELEKSLKN